MAIVDMKFSGQRSIITESRRQFVLFGKWIVNGTAYDSQSNCVAFTVCKDPDREKAILKARQILTSQMNYVEAS